MKLNQDDSWEGQVIKIAKCSLNKPLIIAYI